MNQPKTIDTEPKILILWDIDATRMNMGGLSPWDPAFYNIVAELSGRDFIPMDEHPLHGTTDKFIFDAFLKNQGVDDRERPAMVERALTMVVEAMAATRELILSTGYAVDNVRETTELFHQAGALQTCVTGNVEGNAEFKLELFDVLDHIDIEVGGYGSDSAVRAELVPIALKKVIDKYGVEFGKDRIFIIGDTQFDLEAAANNGIHGITMATGKTNYRDLAQLSPPHLTYPDFSKPGRMLRDMARLAGVELWAGRTAETTNGRSLETPSITPPPGYAAEQ